jgi:hypothetical protein
MNLTVKQKIFIHAGLLPLWVLPLIALYAIKILTIIFISFGLLTEKSITPIGVAFHVIVQAVVLIIAVNYIKLMKWIVTRNTSPITLIPLFLWFIPAVLEILVYISGFSMPLKWTQVLIFLPPAFIHLYFLWAK